MLTMSERATAEAAGMPANAMTECRVFLRRDLNTDAPKEAVGWVVWHGGFAELHTWPWDASGLAAAGVWAIDHRAVDHAGYPIRHRDQLLVHVGSL